MAILLWCRKCQIGRACVKDIPPVCPNCLTVTTWTTFAPQPDPAAPFALTALDRRLLRTLAIDPQD